MQTLISVFDDRADARKAIDRLVQQGFSREDVHLQEGGEAPRNEEAIHQLADTTMHTAEREIAVDRGVLESLGHFFVSLFGEDRGEKAAGTYGGHVGRGHSVVVVDARSDQEAEAAAVTLHECGAVDVDDHHNVTAGSTTIHPGVHAYQREAPSLRDMAHQRNVREESIMASRSGQVTNELKEDREERAYAAPMTNTDRDRPK